MYSYVFTKVVFLCRATCSQRWYFYVEYESYVFTKVVFLCRIRKLRVPKGGISM